MKPITAIPLSFALLTLAGCSTVDTAKEAQGSGQMKTYYVTQEKAWPAMLNAVEQTGGAIKEQNEEQCYVLAAYGVTAFSWGEKVAVFCNSSHGSTDIEVVMKAALKTNVSAVKRAPEIFSAIDIALAEQPADEKANADPELTDN